MEEGEYKSTYNEIAAIRCVFEKALTNHQARCSLSRLFCLADREGVCCKSKEFSVKCGELLKKLREKSVFVLKLQEIAGPLPHNMEIRVQAGGLQGLAKLVEDITMGSEHSSQVDDISRVLEQVTKKYGSLEDLPYSEIIQSVVQFQGRRRRPK
ncbi:MAG: hypothetical protein RQ982_11375 [Gammaproteobacteria bacterium]|nr:hypothetical protein [Gammaproteobacteria bacterium]